MHILVFMVAVNITNLAQRLLGKYLYEKREYDLKKIYPYLYWYYHGSYAIWSLINIIEFFDLPLHCKKIDNWSMWVWEIACFIGLKSICIGTFGLLMAIFVLPCMLYSDRREERERNAQRDQQVQEQQATQLFIQNLPETKYVLGQSEQTECSVCLLPFNETENVTYFPCQSNHLFHSECIKKWV